MRDPQRGGASVMVVWVSALLGFVVLAGIGVTAVVHTQVRASQAADLAALAGADAVWGGGSQACAEARRIAAAQEATLEYCRSDGLDVQVGVSVPVPLTAGQGAAATAEARAGPPGLDASG